MRNFVNISGNITHDLELRYTPSGAAVLDFSVAVNESYNTKDGDRREKVAFINVTAWNDNAERVAKFFKKGRPIEVVGKLVQESWEDKSTGEKRSKLKVELDRWEFVGGPKPKSDESDESDEQESEAPAPKPAAKKSPVKPAGKRPKPQDDEDGDGSIDF